MSLIFTAPGTDARENLALDEFFLNALPPGQILLYFYINRPSVIIGRNQNPFLECDVSRMKRDGVILARRVSGGGAVYHDEGNLNYSFLAHESVYDELRQTKMILDALKKLGLEAEVTGRNDICLDGLKISGNAFAKRGSNRMRHGTLLVDADLSVFSNYLTPSPLKLEAKGIKSVRSRVGNLKEKAPDITLCGLKEAIVREFEAVYGKAEDVSLFAGHEDEVSELIKKHFSEEWLYGQTPAYDAQLEARLSWGLARLCFKVKEGRITDFGLFTDSLDTEIAVRIQNMLKGRPFGRDSIVSALNEGDENARELARALSEMAF
ncbi:MAG: lipoate--protein ligase [Clostridiales bacterium]|nr:lipoate--protein ligase [Clostridiales bacterium]